jgi:hypothetical protein
MNAKILGGLVIVATVAACLVGPPPRVTPSRSAGTATAAATVTAPTRRITEDDPRWDCEVMGNRVCGTPAPTTAVGFAHLFATLNPSEWGAADVAISVPLGDGRSVWLFGDTLSTRRFVHSSAITESGGSLHVSHHGAQLLPNVDAETIYWIDGGKETAEGLTISARAIRLTGTGPWDFTDAGWSRTALATVSPAGDVTFVRWLSKTSSPAPNPGRMYVYGPHHFGYARHTHPEFKLADGHVLVTTCQNWDDGKTHPLAAYRPLFSEGN